MHHFYKELYDTGVHDHTAWPYIEILNLAISNKPLNYSHELLDTLQKWPPTQQQPLEVPSILSLSISRNNAELLIASSDVEKVAAVISMVDTTVVTPKMTTGQV